MADLSFMLSMWYIPVVSVFHFMNSVFGVEAEIANPGSSVLGKWWHHRLDGVIHIFIILGIGRTYRQKSFETWQIVVFFLARLIIEPLPIGGISYDLVYNQNNQETVGGAEPKDWWKFMFFNASTHTGWNGGVYFGYAGGVLLCLALILVAPAKGPPLTNLLCVSFIVQLLFIVFFVFNPSANAIFAASESSALRAVQIYFAHAADLIAWNSPFWLYVLPPDWYKKRQHGDSVKDQ